MSQTRPELEAEGITHRHGCPAPAPEILHSRVAGFRFHRCTECGAAKLERTTTNRPQP